LFHHSKSFVVVVFVCLCHEGVDPVKRWALSYKPKGISMTVDGRILVTYQEDRRVQELSSDGVVMRDIALPEDMLSPWHTVSSPLGSSPIGALLVCHGNVNDHLQRLAII